MGRETAEEERRAGGGDECQSEGERKKAKCRKWTKWMAMERKQLAGIWQRRKGGRREDSGWRGGGAEEEVQRRARRKWGWRRCRSVTDGR